MGRGETCRSLDQQTGLYKGDRRRVGNKGGMEGGGCVSVGRKNHTHSPPPHTSTVDWVEDVGLEVTEEPDRQIFSPWGGGVNKEQRRLGGGGARGLKKRPLLSYIYLYNIMLNSGCNNNKFLRSL